jgi:phosphoribosyl-AMP cyclohydrolase
MEIQFKNGLVPVIVQEKRTREVLMLAYASAEALDLTLTTGYAHYYSRSRQKLWKKGEESGHVQRVCRVLVDCDADTILYEVSRPAQPATPVMPPVSTERSKGRRSPEWSLIRRRYTLIRVNDLTNMVIFYENCTRYKRRDRRTHNIDDKNRGI